MIVGVLKEIKQDEYRVSLLPDGVDILTSKGHKVFVEKDAGLGSGFTNELYEKSGAVIIDTAKEVYEQAELILKVKEPLAQEYSLIRKGQIVFTFFHFAASRELTVGMAETEAICIAYETVQKDDGSLPILIPMSEIAGRMAIQAGAKFLEKVHGGRGILLSEVPGVKPVEVLIIGGGMVGINAALSASGLGARVIILDNNLYHLRYLNTIMPSNVSTLMSISYDIRDFLKNSDLVVGAVLIPGAKSPKLVTKDMLKIMKAGSVVVDVSIDQGGCFETSRPTTHHDPVYVVDNIIHYCVANIPGAVPFTSTIALNNATFPYILKLCNEGFEKCVETDREIRRGVDIYRGKITNKKVADEFDIEYVPFDELRGN
ncbi:alanine dehydrogenase [candidate division KSB1 bacterium]